MFGYPETKWNAAKEEARSIMIDVARSRDGLITYNDLASRILAIRFLDGHVHALHEMLGQISRAEYESGNGMLSVVVVLKESKMPGKGFFTLAAELGRTVRDPIAFFVDELEAVRSFWEAAWLRGVLR